MATTKPDETTEETTEDIEVAEAVEADVELEDEDEAITDITQIESLDDAKDVFWNGVDKIRDSSADEVRQGAIKVGNRLYKAWRKLVDGD